MADDAQPSHEDEPLETQATPFDQADTGTQALAPDLLVGPDTSAATEPAGTSRSSVVPRTTFPVPRGRVLVPERGAPRVHDRRLGSELVDLPRIVDTEPADAILVDPQIPERKRKCWNCGTPLARESGPHAGPMTGECPNCGVRYSFVPGLEPGTVVADQYEILGAIAHGGMGWIYVATDRNVSDRPVVLKGLLNSGDSAAQAVAVAERQFLASVSHPGIVKIYNFVEHGLHDDRTIGYIVMEYIGGKTLKQLTAPPEGSMTPTLLSPEQAMAYLLEVLPAVGYLHSVGLVYNDVKPDNIMVSASDVTLIDLGAVAPIGGHGRLYGTPGFQAPEIIETGPQVATDIYSIGRTLAVLTVDMPMEGGQYLPGLPDVDDVPLFAENPSFHLLLARATATNPDERFASTAEMTTQVLNVLRETVAVHTGVPRPAMSTVFTPPRSTFGTELLLGPVDAFFDPDQASFYDPADIAAALPVPLIDPADPAARVLSSAALSDPRQILDSISAHRADLVSANDTDYAPPRASLEIELAEARAYLELDDVDTALGVLRGADQHHGHNWRIEWYLGICALRNDEPELAYERFNETLEAMPGEIGPKLAVAGTAELIGRWLAGESADTGTGGDLDPQVRQWYEIARHHYQDLWFTDHAIITAAFGLARIHLAYGEVAKAIVGLDEVPPTSRHYNTARETAVMALVHGRPVSQVTHSEIVEAADRLEKIPDAEPRKPRIKLIVLGTALGWVLANEPSEGLPDLLGYPFTEYGLRTGTEQSLRDLARETRTNRAHRFQLVDLANYVRPATWF
ncbi:serine/threonine protein kinase PknG [Gordonia araii NBRC 100433]|uniref:Serine/threonine-protein kinase PknG n=1 Tax=Gordonia araii NBRC 100433 TaxID=1073574 RepID=G7GY34_9ACTN|nr:serine/threonine-protein kinase [Gordonia araii]GAB08509.1 serine/threonine protein kinase PknG [Gordonia araii NBRC 100433]